MIKFRDFLIEEVRGFDASKAIEYLPLKGHQAVGIAADMLDGIHDTLQGKRSKIQTASQFKGTPITFGFDPHTKKMFVGHNGQINNTFQDIQQNYADKPNLMASLMSTAEHLPKVLPRKNDYYNGTVLFSDYSKKPAWIPPSNAKIGLSVVSNSKGKLLKPSDRVAFNAHPDVHMEDPTMKTNPEIYGIDHQREYLDHMNNAKKAYRNMDPYAFDQISAHQALIQKHMDYMHGTGQQPTFDSYMDDLQDMYKAKADEEEGSLKKDNRVKRYSELAHQAMTHQKDFEGVFDMLDSLKNAKNVLADRARESGNPADIMVRHPQGDATLRLTKA